MRQHLIIFTILLITTGCASTPSYKDPNVVYIDEIKVTNTEGKTHVGIFADKTFQYNIAQDSEPGSNENKIVLEIENADTTYTILPAIEDQDVVLSSITKEQSFNQKGMPISRVSINLKSNYPYDALQTKYGARVEITSAEIPEGEATELGSATPEETPVAEASVPPPPPLAEAAPPVLLNGVEEANALPRIIGLDVLEFPEKNQFIITTDKPVQFSQEQSSQELLLKLDKAFISDNLKQPIDFSSTDYPIVSITPYVQGSVVAFDMALRGDIYPIITQEGSVIYVDVPKISIAAAPTTQPVDQVPPMVATNTTPVLQPNAQFINLNLRNANLTDVIAMISKSANVNIVAGPDAKGKVTVNIKDTPWDQALMTILRSHHLTYVREGNSFRVTSLKSIEEDKQYGPFEDAVVRLDFANADKIKEEITPFLSQYGKITQDPRTNSLVVRDLKGNINKIKLLISKIDGEEQNVLFDTQFVEVSPAFTKQLGIQWAGSANTSSLSDALVGTLKQEGNLYFLLEQAEDDDLVKIISSSKITTVANKEFEIKSFREISFQGKDGTEFKPYNVGFKGITKITSDQSIILTLDLQRKFPRISKLFNHQDAGGQFASTELKMINGETTVISWSIPGASETPKDLMVFLTPRLF